MLADALAFATCGVGDSVVSFFTVVPVGVFVVTVVSVLIVVGDIVSVF